MKSDRLAIGLFILVCIVGGVALRRHFRLYYPTPETESAFLRRYTPEHVIDRFRENDGFSHTRPFNGGAGRTFANHEAGFEFLCRPTTRKLDAPDECVARRCPATAFQ